MTMPNNDKSGELALIVKNALKHIVTPAPDKEHTKTKRIWTFNCVYPTSHKIYNVYNKNTNSSILNSITNFKTSPNDILMGDLNSYPDPVMDRFSTVKNTGKNFKFIHKLMNLDWIDTYKVCNPTSQSHKCKIEHCWTKGVTHASGH